MSNDKKPAEEKAEEKNDSSFSDIKPTKLDESDEKIIKKQVKKKGVDEDHARHNRFVIKNGEKVERLWHEFNSKIIELGHVVEPVLQQTPNMIKANFNFRPLSLEEMKHGLEVVKNVDARLEKKHEKNKIGVDQAKPGADETVEQVEDAETGRILTFKKDGDKFCCHDDDFVNLQESVAGFGATKEEAKSNYLKAVDAEKAKGQTKSEHSSEDNELSRNSDLKT